MLGETLPATALRVMMIQARQNLEHCVGRRDEPNYRDICGLRPCAAVFRLSSNK
jgi:hypothetical protein